MLIIFYSYYIDESHKNLIQLLAKLFPFSFVILPKVPSGYRSQSFHLDPESGKVATV